MSSNRAFWICGLVLFVLAGPVLGQASYDYGVTFVHDGDDRPVELRAWAPTGVELRGTLYLPPCLGGDTRRYVDNEVYQAMAESIGFAIVGYKDRDGWPGKFLGNTDAEVRSNVQLALDGAAAGLNCQQISNAPLAFYGFSKGGWTDGMLANGMPERTIGFAADKCGTWIYSIHDESAYAPGLFINGSEDHTCGTGAPYSAFREWSSPTVGQVGMVMDWNVGHSYTNFGLVAAFVDQCIAVRYPQDQAVSSAPNSAMTLTQTPRSGGWLVETSYTSGSPTWIRQPEVARYDEYTGDKTYASWCPTETMAKVFRAVAAADPDTGATPIAFGISTAPQGSAVAYEVGQSIEMTVSNAWLELDDVTGVRIYHEGELIDEFDSLTTAGVRTDYLLDERGIHVFLAEATYMYGGQETIGSSYMTVIVTPEPTTLVALVGAGLFALTRRKRCATA